MRKVSRKILSVLLTLILLFSAIPLGAVTVSANGNTTLAALQSKYPHGKYWNGGDPNTYTSTPCTHHGSCIVTGGCYCNCFKGHAIQCMGFAYQLASLVYGGDPWAEWTKNTNQSALNSLKAGDVVRYKNNGHSIFVTAVNGDTVTYADCNSDGHCIIRWNQTISKSTLKSTFSYVDPAPYAWDGGPECTCSTTYAGTYICTTSSLDLTMRSGHGSSYSSVGSIPSGATVTVTKASGTSSSDWAHVTYNGISGYASMQYLSKKQEHTHDYSDSKKYYEAEHPHRIQLRCKDYDTCGGYKWIDEYHSVNTCQQCWYFNTSPDKTSVTISTNASTEVTLNTSMFYPDSAIMSVDYDTSIVDATINSGVVKFTGKKVGSTNYKISVYSDSNKSYLIGSCTIKVTVTNNYNVSFSKSSINLTRPSKTTDTVTVTLSGNWPDNAGYILEYDDSIISYTQDVATFTLKAIKAGTTKFRIKIVDKNDTSIVYDDDACIVRITDDTYTVTYDANGGTGAPANQIKTYDKTLTLSSTEPIRDGYMFLGWATSSSATSAFCQPGDYYKGNYNIELYAVWEKITIRSVKIQFEPHKTDYYIGDTLETDGLQLKVVYSDGLEKYITSGFTVSGFNSATSGTKVLTVSYSGFTNTFNVTVVTPFITLSSVSKTLEVGETTNLTATTTPSGQSVTWTSSNTSAATVSSGTITAKATGTATITAKFTYNGYTYSKTCVVTVTSTTDPAILTSISVSSMPSKTVYQIGESLNTSGLKLKLTYSDGSTSSITSGFTTSGFSSTTAGTKAVTVSYNGKTTTFNVTVNSAPIGDEPTIVVDTVSAVAGETVTITVNLKNNDGFGGMAYDVVYDNTKLELTSYEVVLGALICTDSGIDTYPNKINFQYAGTSNITGDDVLVSLTFKIKDTAEECFASVTVVPEDGTFFRYDGRNEIDFSVVAVNGGVNIVDYMKGDINGDGKVNNRDSARLLQMLAGWDVDYVDAALDVNGDGKINNRDAARILQYLAGWDVTLN